VHYLSSRRNGFTTKTVRHLNRLHIGSTKP
jgi:hypothetical protein